MTDSLSEYLFPCIHLPTSPTMPFGFNMVGEVGDRASPERYAYQGDVMQSEWIHMGYNVKREELRGESCKWPKAGIWSISEKDIVGSLNRVMDSKTKQIKTNKQKPNTQRCL